MFRVGTSNAWGATDDKREQEKENEASWSEADQLGRKSMAQLVDENGEKRPHDETDETRQNRYRGKEE